MFTKRPPAPSITYAQWRARKAEQLKQKQIRTGSIAKKVQAQNYRRLAFRLGKR